MTKTVRIRNIDDDVYAALARLAAERGVTVPGLLRRQALRLALETPTTRLSVAEWLECTRTKSTGITRGDVIEALDEHRGPWPDPSQGTPG